MKKLLGLVALLTLSTLPALAQSEGYPKFEVGGGFMYRNYDLQESPRQNEPGWFLTADYNFANWLGLDLDIDEGFVAANSVSFQFHHFTFMAGPQVYPLGHRKLTPFAHALFGDSSEFFSAQDEFPAFSDNRFAWEIGGGVDWSVTHHIAVRLGEFDFEQTHNFGNPVQNNFKYKGGVVFRF